VFNKSIKRKILYNRFRFPWYVFSVVECLAIKSAAEWPVETYFLSPNARGEGAAFM